MSAATVAVLPSLAVTTMLAGGAIARAVTAPPKVVSARLTDVSCKGDSFCMVSGVYDTRQRKGNRLAEQWTGKSWQDVRDPVKGHLLGISCGSAKFCFAADLIRNKPGSPARWNGRTWQVYNNRAAFGATCGSPTLCMNLANNGVDIDVWNGKRWKINPAANACDGGPPDNPECGYNSLSCGSASNCLGFFFSCTDVNCVDGPDQFDSVWNGSTWNQEGFGVPAKAGALSCSPGQFCMNVTPTTVSIRDSAGWQDVTPDLSTLCTSAQHCSLTGPLSCGAPQSCFILPSGSPVSLLWSHLTWKAVPLAKIHGKLPNLASLSCGSARNCMAVGNFGTPSQPVAEHWNGTRWQLTKPINH